MKFFAVFCPNILDGILYVIRTGGAWLMMPKDLPAWKTCYPYFRLWAKEVIWGQVHEKLRDKSRLAQGKKAPTAAILDSQSDGTASQPGVRGYDAGKKIIGRKRHVLVDTRGHLLALKVTPTDVHGRYGARLLICQFIQGDLDQSMFPMLVKGAQELADFPRRPFRQIDG